jgi:hypothetical protein
MNSTAVVAVLVAATSAHRGHVQIDPFRSALQVFVIVTHGIFVPETLAQINSSPIHKVLT